MSESHAGLVLYASSGRIWAMARSVAKGACLLRESACVCYLTSDNRDNRGDCAPFPQWPVAPLLCVSCLDGYRAPWRSERINAERLVKPFAHV